ncbi:hypothetical protein ABBQ32_013620 [Trebouxia sp. C0010 RCD-2024]
MRQSHKKPEGMSTAPAACGLPALLCGWLQFLMVKDGFRFVDEVKREGGKSRWLDWHGQVGMDSSCWNFHGTTGWVFGSLTSILPGLYSTLTPTLRKFAPSLKYLNAVKCFSDRRLPSKCEYACHG